MRRLVLRRHRSSEKESLRPSTHRTAQIQPENRARVTTHTAISEPNVKHELLRSEWPRTDELTDELLPSAANGRSATVKPMQRSRPSPPDEETSSWKTATAGGCGVGIGGAVGGGGGALGGPVGGDGGGASGGGGEGAAGATTTMPCVRSE
jgi:hypothetical protein